MVIDKHGRHHDARGRYAAQRIVGTDDDLEEPSWVAALQLAKRRNVDTLYRAARIEVPGVTFPQTAEILAGVAPAGVDAATVMVINNLKHAWQFLTSQAACRLDWQTVCEYNRLVGEHIEPQPGQARSVMVRISGTDYVPPAFTDTARASETIRRLGEQADQARAACEMFAVICREQWFSNGNKRSAVMAANHMLIHSGVGLFALPAGQAESEFRDELIRYYESGAVGRFVDWLTYHAVGRVADGGQTQAQLDGEFLT